MRVRAYGVGFVLGAAGLLAAACGDDVDLDGSGSGSATGGSTSTAGASGDDASETTASPPPDTDADTEADETGPPPPPPPLPPIPECGDGVVDEYEECDDGNIDDTDACSNDCIPTAALVWELIIPPEVQATCVNDVAVSPSGAIALGGSTHLGAGSEGFNAWIAVLSAEGELQWDDQWDGGDAERDEVMGVGFDAAGDLYLAVTEDNGPTNAWLYRRDPDGVEQWGVSLERPGEAANVVHDMVVAPDGSAVVLAATYDDPAGSQRLQAFDAAGVPLWPSSVVAPGFSDPDRSSLGRDAAGGLYVVDARGLPGGRVRQGHLDHYSPDGILQWTALSEPPLDFEGDRPALGITRADGTTTMALFDVFAPEALVLRSWDALGAGPATVDPGLDIDLRLNDGVADPSGGSYLAGRETFGGTVVALDSEGALQWVRRHTASGGVRINTVAVAPNGDVIVAGCTASVKGSAWVRRYLP